MRVLVADDEAVLCETYEAFLSDLDVEVIASHQAEDAVEQVRQALAEADPFTIAFLDVNMPPGRDGIWAAEQIRALDPTIELVIVTAYEDISPLEISERVPPAEKLLYVQKPVHPHELSQLAHSLRAKWHAGRKLEASLARLATAQHLAGFGHWELDPLTARARWSEELARLFGLPEGRDEGPLEVLWERVHPDDIASVRASVDEAWAGDARRPLEYRIRLPDGSERHIQHELAAISGGAGDSLQLVGAALDLTERKKIEEQVRHLAYHDPLTGLRNRSFLTEYLPLVLKQTVRNNRNTALLYIDLDYFKRVNDSYGHSTGDQLLREVAVRLERCLRESDIVARGLLDDDDLEPEEAASGDAADAIARLGGDEFIVLLTEVARPEDPGIVAERIQTTLAEPFLVGGRSVQIASSIGIASCPADGEDPDALVRKADAAMFQAKENGRNGYEFFTAALNQTVLERMERERCLGEAVERQEFVLHFQPKVAGRESRIVGAEALVRWNHPQDGLVEPGQFIPLAEETGLIVPLGRWVMAEAYAQLARWQEEGFAAVPVSVNLSFRQFKDEKLLDTLREIIEGTGIDPGHVEVEFTESTLMDDSEHSRRLLTELTGLGLRTALDDFGTGYSSLSSLKRLPLDILKLDRSFLRELLTNKTDEAIVRAIIAMARELEIEVLAEGVESDAQLARLEEMGCYLFQGYHVGRPAPAAEFAERYLERAKPEED